MWGKQSPCQPLGGPWPHSPLRWSRCPDRAAGPESCHLQGDLGAASRKPDMQAAECTGLFSEVSRRALLRQARWAAEIRDSVAMSGVSLQSGAGQGKPTCLCPGILGVIHGDCTMEFQNLGVCQDLL